MGSISDELRQLFDLRNAGALTESEFTLAKQQVLEGGTVEQAPADTAPASPPAAERDTGPVDLRDASWLGEFFDEVSYVGSMRLSSDNYIRNVFDRSSLGDDDTWRLIWTGREGFREVIALPIWEKAPYATGAMNDILRLLPSEAVNFTQAGQATTLLDILDPSAGDRRPRAAPQTAKALRRLLKALPSPVYATAFRELLAPLFAQHDAEPEPIEFVLPGHPSARVSAAGFLGTAAHSLLDELLACECDYDEGCLCEFGSTVTWFYRGAQGVWQLHDVLNPPRAAWDPPATRAPDDPFVQVHFDAGDLQAWVGFHRDDYDPYLD